MHILWVQDYVSECPEAKLEACSVPANKRTTYKDEDVSHFSLLYLAAARARRIEEGRGGRKDRERGELFANRLKSGWTAAAHAARPPAAAAVALDRSHVRPRELAPSIVLAMIGHSPLSLSLSLLPPFLKESETPMLSRKTYF